MTPEEFLYDEYCITLIPNEKTLIHPDMLTKAMREYAQYTLTENMLPINACNYRDKSNNDKLTNLNNIYDVTTNNTENLNTTDVGFGCWW